MAALLAKMAEQRIYGHAGATKDRVHLLMSNANSWHQDKQHLHPERHLRHLVTMMVLKVPKSQICLPDMDIHLHIFPALNCSFMTHLPRIASTMMIWFQICGLMREHTLVSTLSAAWWYSKHPFCRRQQLIEWDCKWKQTWIVWNMIIECSIIYNYCTLYSMF